KTTGPLPKYLLGNAEGVGVGFDDIAEFAGIATAHAHSDRDAVIPRGCEHNTIAPATTLARYAESSELIGFKNVNTCLIENKIRLHPIDKHLETFLKCMQVDIIACEVRQRYVEIRHLLFKGII